MYIDKYGRQWEGLYPFNLEEISSKAPGDYGVYQILYTPEKKIQIAYIGIATGDTIRGRLKKHCTGKGNWALSRLGNPSSFSFSFHRCDEISAKQIESYIVTWEKPPFNVRPEYKHLIPSIMYH